MSARGKPAVLPSDLGYPIAGQTIHTGRQVYQRPGHLSGEIFYHGTILKLAAGYRTWQSCSKPRDCLFKPAALISYES